MRKTVLTLAACATLCAPALAQSPVIVYGIADAGIGRIRTLSAKDPRAGQNPFVYPDVEGGNGRTQFTSHSLMNNVNSRFGLRGAEDLGAGLRAGFVLETGLDLDDGAADRVPAFLQRQAALWLGSAWGTLKLGRQFTPSLLAQAAYEITSGANYSPLNNSFEAAGLGKRASSAFVYTSHAGAKKNIWDLGLKYTRAPLTAGVGINKGADGGSTNYHMGGKYSLGSVAIAASYNSASTEGVPELRRRGWSLGASVSMGAITLAADLVRDTKNPWHGKKMTNAVVEARYAFSKHTFAYGAALRLDGQNNWGLGICYSF